MKIRVERCWAGGENFHFRMTTPDGKRENVSGENWTRKLATEALDLFERLYGYNRTNIRFSHK